MLLQVAVVVVVGAASNVAKKATCREIVRTPAQLVVAVVAAVEPVTSVARTDILVVTVQKEAAVEVAGVALVTNAVRTGIFLVTVQILDQATEEADEVTTSCDVTFAVTVVEACVICCFDLLCWLC